MYITFQARGHEQKMAGKNTWLEASVRRKGIQEAASGCWGTGQMKEKKNNSLERIRAGSKSPMEIACMQSVVRATSVGNRDFPLKSERSGSIR